MYYIASNDYRSETYIGKPEYFQQEQEKELVSIYIKENDHLTAKSLEISDFDDPLVSIFLKQGIVYVATEKTIWKYDQNLKDIQLKQCDDYQQTITESKSFQNVEIVLHDTYSEKKLTAIVDFDLLINYNFENARQENSKCIYNYKPEITETSIKNIKINFDPIFDTLETF